jgi:hypothetical protein
MVAPHIELVKLPPLSRKPWFPLLSLKILDDLPPRRRSFANDAD